MIEKRNRFFRRYELHFSPRVKNAYALPLIAKDGEISVLAALRLAMSKKKASLSQHNQDKIDLVAIDYQESAGLLVLLFHRASPNAADPAYRKTVKDTISLRLSKKEAEEEQAVSAHLIVSTKKGSSGAYSAALEEMPGLSFTVVSSIIRLALGEYKYPYKDKKGEEQETYSTLKALGLKSESLSSALKKNGSVNYLTLTRTNIPDSPDSDGIAEPQIERIKYKIIGNPNTADWKSKLWKFHSKIRNEGWDDISLDLSLEDTRHRTVKLDREVSAAEIMFVRAEQIFVDGDLDPCTMKIVPELVIAAKKLISKG